MSKTISVTLPDEALEGYLRSATAAGKPLEQFLAERLTEVVPFVSDKLPANVQSEMQSLERLDNLALAEAAQCRLSDDKQREYDRLLSKQTGDLLSAEEAKTLNTIGEEARRLTLRRAHALMLLKWRGQKLPECDEPTDLE